MILKWLYGKHQEGLMWNLHLWIKPAYSYLFFDMDYPHKLIYYKFYHLTKCVHQQLVEYSTAFTWSKPTIQWFSDYYSVHVICGYCLHHVLHFYINFIFSVMDGFIPKPLSYVSNNYHWYATHNHIYFLQLGMYCTLVYVCYY